MIAEVLTLENHFADAESCFLSIIDWISCEESNLLEHYTIEEELTHRGRELMRRLYQGHLDARGKGSLGISLVGGDQVQRKSQRESSRQQQSVFGRVVIERLAYQENAVPSVMPKDASLNLPPELYSHGLSEKVALGAARGSFDEALEVVFENTGVRVPKRQVEEISTRAAQDFDSFYESRKVTKKEKVKTPIIALTMDGKGIVMRKEDLRPATRAAAEKESGKAKKRLKKGEKRNRKRMSTVASVYTIERYERTPEQIVSQLGPVREVCEKKRPKPESKRVWASIQKERSQVVEEMYDEAQFLDPESEKEWVVLLDGNPRQLKDVQKEAKKREVKPTIILDIIHVLEYLWKAVYVFHKEGSQEAEEWVSTRLLWILQGKVSRVAGGIRRSATRQKVKGAKRKKVDTCCNYLLKNKELMRYEQYLAAGYPIGTGVIEGACRYLVKDRMERTGARWSLQGAEAILRLRALVLSGDFSEYWKHHIGREYERHHSFHFPRPPELTSEPGTKGKNAHLRVVK
jgi:hypothetical protein